MHCTHHSLSFTRAVCLLLAPLLGQLSSVYLPFIQSSCASFYIMCFSLFSCMWCCIAHMTLHQQYHPPNPHPLFPSSMKVCLRQFRETVGFLKDGHVSNCVLTLLDCAIFINETHQDILTAKALNIACMYLR